MKTLPFALPALSARRAAILGACAGLCLTLAGCAGFTTVNPASVAEVETGHATGKVAGGNQPVAGAHIFFYGVGAGGYGSAATSLLISGTTGVTTDASGSYLTTDGTGSFNFTSANYSCASPVVRYVTPTYMVAVGGNPGLSPSTVDNSAIVLMAALPTCGNYSSLSRITINELSTAAMVTAVQQFMVDAAHIGSSASNSAGIVNAFNSVNDLYTLGAGAARATNLAGTGTVAQMKLNTLGDILTPCVNSAAPTSTDCQNLFSAATPAGGTAPTTVAGAMLLIASNPTSQVSTLYGLSTANAPFQSALNAAPNDWAIGIALKGGGLAYPTNVLIDASNNAWVASCATCAGASGTDTFVELSPAGTILSGANGYSTGVHDPQGMAFDSLGNLWSVEVALGNAPDQIVKMNSSGGVIFAFNDSTLSNPEGIALDNGNNAWITNLNTSSVEKINQNGTRTLAPVTQSGFYFPLGIAIDSLQYIYAAGTGSGSVLKLQNDGTVLNNYSPNGVTQPLSVSIDSGDNIFSVNNDTSLVSEFNGANGTAAANSPYAVGIANANVVSLDGVGSGWTASSNSTSSSLLHFSAAGVALSNLQDESLSSSASSAIDQSGNVWVTNTGNASVTEFLGVAAPVVTPLAVASGASKLATKP